MYRMAQVLAFRIAPRGQQPPSCDSLTPAKIPYYYSVRWDPRESQTQRASGEVSRCWMRVLVLTSQTSEFNKGWLLRMEELRIKINKSCDNSTLGSEPS